jgi:hypothetical protein
MTQENLKDAKKETSTINFNLATILHEIRADKYSHDVKETFSIEDGSTNEKFRIPKEKVLDIAKCIKDSESLNYLISNGWPAGEKMKAGSGLAVKINLNSEFYELTFYIGEAGEAFDSSKVIRRSYIKIEKTVLNTIFEYLKYNDKVLAQKAEMQRVQRTTLTLG